MEQRERLNAEQISHSADFLYESFKAVNGSLWAVIRGIKDHADIWYSHISGIETYIDKEKLRRKILIFSGQDDGPLIRIITDRVVERILGDD